MPAYNTVFSDQKIAERKYARSKEKSSFTKYSITFISCILIASLGFITIVFSRTDDVNIALLNTVNIHSSYITARTTVKDIEQEEFADDKDEEYDAVIDDVVDEEVTMPGVSYEPGSTSEYASAIISCMRDRGYNDFAIAGALGNFAAESGLNPTVTQGHTCDGADNATVREWQAGKSGRAIGFAQWDGGRALALIDAADKAGVPWYDFNFQLNHYLSDLEMNGYGVEQANSNATDIEHAAWYFVKKYERCGTCKYAPCGGSANGAHGVGTNAAYVDFVNREHINGWAHRRDGAGTFYATYFQ